MIWIWIGLFCVAVALIAFASCGGTTFGSMRVNGASPRSKEEREENGRARERWLESGGVERRGQK